MTISLEQHKERVHAAKTARDALVHLEKQGTMIERTARAWLIAQLGLLLTAEEKIVARIEARATAGRER